MSEYRNPNTCMNFLQIMAVVHQYIIIYFTLIIQESRSFSIHRNLCLEAVERFTNHLDNCKFDLRTTESILQDVTTCPKKCSFRIDDLDSYNYFYLNKIYLTIDNEERIFTLCSRQFKKNLHINCPSWNAGEYKTWDNAYSCFIKDAECVSINNYCICQCIAGYNLEGGEKCLKTRVNIGGICEHNWQCTGTESADICVNGLCSCSPGYIKIDRKCYQGNLGLNDSCELTVQCTQPFSVCFHGKCKCMKGYSAFDTDSCIKDTVPVGGFCNLSHQCTGSSNSGICENGRCTCAKEFTLKDLACEKNHPNSLGIGSLNSQQHGTNIGVTLGSLFGGFILGVIVTAVVTTLMYRRLKFQTRKRQEPDVMFAENREYGSAGDAQISFTNNKKQNVAKLSPYFFSKETQGYNLSRKQENEKTEDVYNHLHEQTEQDDDTYDHACAATNYSADLSDYSNIHDAATVRPTSPSTDGDDYSTLRH